MVRRYLGMLGSTHRGPQMSSDQPYSATPEDHARSICAALPGLVARQIEVSSHCVWDDGEADRGQFTLCLGW